MEATLQSTFEHKNKGHTNVLCPTKLHSFKMEDSFFKSIYFIDICNIRRVQISEDWNAKIGFLSMVSAFSSLLRCHPALIVAFILGDIVPNRYSGVRPLMPSATINILVIKHGEQINIVIPDPRTPLAVVSKVYKMVRELRTRSISETHKKHPRPRFETDKVRKLIDFIRVNSELTWNERFERWNDENSPKFEYSTVQSMQSAYYNALRRIIQYHASIGYQPYSS